jgi:hypothetical protein
VKRVHALIVLAAAALLVGCGGTKSLPHSSPSSRSPADLPPAWVQNEAAWQALAAADPHPRLFRWVLTAPARAAFLGGKATAYLRSQFPDASANRAYVVVLQGRFTRDDGQTGVANTLYLILTVNQHFYLARGFASTSPNLAPLGRLHRSRRGCLSRQACGAIPCSRR